tara:strand:- start:701 stop:1189 length:489 start_codon:yes stop_codon:yes gene_type:complete
MAKLKGIDGVTGPILLGKLYLFRYLPSTPMKYFDLFPLVHIMRQKGNYFEGFNWHYMDMKRRSELYILLEKFFSDMPLQRDSRLIVKELKNLIFKSSRLRDARVSYRKYFKKSITSLVLTIEPPNWNKVIMKPKVEKFLIPGKGPMRDTKVWRETLIQSRKT